MERLPLRVEDQLARVLGVRQGDVCVMPADPGSLPTLHCELPRAVTANASIVLRVHASTGVPIAYSTATVSQGDRVFETARVTLLAMEGYSHLAPAERQQVEGRVWSRRAYATVASGSGAN